MADTDDSEERKLARFLRDRLTRIQTCNCDIENKLRDEEHEYLKYWNGHVIDESDYSKAYNHIDLVVRQTFRYAMLVTVCSFVEDALVRIGKRSDANYNCDIKEIDSNGKMNCAKAHLDLLCKYCGLDATPIKSECESFRQIVTLRNCVVHAWGNVAEDRNPDQVKEAVEHLVESGKEGNFDFVDISRDKCLHLGDNIIVHAILAAQSIIDHIAKSLLGGRL